jgi:hypothetical protein
MECFVDRPFFITLVRIGLFDPLLARMRLGILTCISDVSTLGTDLLTNVPGVKPGLR